MENLGNLKRKIQTATDLHSLVRTMKALAAVNVRQLEKAVDSLDIYKQTVEMGLQIVLRNRERVRLNTRRDRDGAMGVIVFGSDQGMCGQLNDLVARFTYEQPDLASVQTVEPQRVSVGARAAARLEDFGLTVQTTLPVAHSTAGIIPLVQDLLVLIDNWHHQKSIDRVIVIYSEHTSRASYQVKRLDLLPIDQSWLEAVRKQTWPTHQTPTFSMEPNLLFSRLVRQFLFVSLYRSCAESLASENASRLAAMSGAEINIGSRIETLTQQFNQSRQMSITEELLDIASGFEAILSSD